MTTLFTEIDLIRYLYGESTENEKSDIENAAICDGDLGAELLNMKFDLGILDRFRLDPSDFALENIFSFSNAYIQNED